MVIIFSLAYVLSQFLLACKNDIAIINVASLTLVNSIKPYKSFSIIQLEVQRVDMPIILKAYYQQSI